MRDVAGPRPCRHGHRVPVLLLQGPPAGRGPGVLGGAARRPPGPGPGPRGGRVRTRARRLGAGPARHGAPAPAGGGGLRRPGLARRGRHRVPAADGSRHGRHHHPGHRRTPAARPRRAHPDHRPRLVLVAGGLGQRLERHGPRPRRAGGGGPAPAPQRPGPGRPGGTERVRGVAAGDRGDVAAHTGAWSNAQAGSTPDRHGRRPGRSFACAQQFSTTVGKEFVDDLRRRRGGRRPARARSGSSCTRPACATPTSPP